MTTQVDTHGTYRFKTDSNRLGLWLFIISDAFVFGGLLVSRFYLFAGERPELSQLLGAIVTFVLLTSSFFMYRADIDISHGNVKGFSRNILVTIALGVLFLIGVVGLEWPTAPFSVGENAMSSVFFTMTGMHALHVLSGVIFLIIVYRNGKRGLYTQERHFPVEAAAIYWHFVDVVWVFFYPALYLMGHAV
ncbi:MAG: heme-copper oxidase subunit III [Chloroflexota bacterium]|nr:MAG: heme-copper oxidase subunit III [Chloroflexota bacterium]